MVLVAAMILWTSERGTDKMFAIQYLDYDEGTAARWNDVLGARHETREQARTHLKTIRAKDDEWCLYIYRITEVGTPEYYSQPTDAAEY